MENKSWTFSEALTQAAEIFWRSVLNSLNMGTGCPDSCGVSIIGNSQNLIEYFPLYSALADPALGSARDDVTSRSDFSQQPFYEIMKKSHTPLFPTCIPEIPDLCPLVQQLLTSSLILHTTSFFSHTQTYCYTPIVTPCTPPSQSTHRILNPNHLVSS